jgi:hypothetical protein
MAIWYILWSFGIFSGYLVDYFRFGMLQQEKSGNPVLELKHDVGAWTRYVII